MLLEKFSSHNSTEIKEKINRFLYVVQVGLAKNRRMF
jgi:predicted GNAT superfamily acetyltransferase